MKILVCGGRDYADQRRLYDALDEVDRWDVHAAERHLGLAGACAWESAPGITCLVHGAGRGADLLAEAWAKERQRPYRGHPAPWDARGKGAGQWRNGEMLRREHTRAFPVALCVAFPGGSGTANMVRRCREVGIPVLEVDQGGCQA